MKDRKSKEEPQKITDLELKVYNASLEFAAEMKQRDDPEDKSYYRVIMIKTTEGKFTLIEVRGKEGENNSSYIGSISIKDGKPSIPVISDKEDKFTTTDRQYLEYLIENIPELKPYAPDNF